MTVVEKINNLYKHANNIVKQRLEEANKVEVLIGKLEAVSGFSIDILIKMFAMGYKLKKEDKQ